jgi:hypothetical protein
MKDKSDIPEKEILVKPRSVSVARSTRGRRSKAEPSSARAHLGLDSEESLSPKSGGMVVPKFPRFQISDIQKISLQTLGLSTLVLFLIFCWAVLLHKSDDGLLSHDPADGKAVPPNYEMKIWLNNKLPWIRKLCVPELIKIPSDNPSSGDSGTCRKGSAYICPGCPVCPDAIACVTDFGAATGNIKDPFELPLPPFQSTFDDASSFTQQLFNTMYKAIEEYPWTFLLLTLFAAWKSMELLLWVGKKGGSCGASLAKYVARLLQNDKKGFDLDAESEKARKEAEAKLLLRMRTIERDEADGTAG